MTKKARLLPLLLFALYLNGCVNQETSAIESVITEDLNKLKNLDADTAREYISAENLFPNIQSTNSVQNSVEDFISNYFQNFDYKILDIKANGDSATVSLRLQTLDAKNLAKDYAGAQLQNQILDASASELKISPASEDPYQLLCQLMKDNDYETVENSCTIHLNKVQDTWIIQKTAVLENEMIGDFITYISNSNLLTPEETLNIYLSTIRSMDEDQLVRYLNLESYRNNEDPTIYRFTSVIIHQVMSDFSYSIKETIQEGYKATVDLEVTTFDVNAAIAEYNSHYQQYLETPESLYDGTQGRFQKAWTLMQKCLEQSNQTITLTIPIEMVNNGKSWTIQNPEQIGNSILGSLNTNLASGLSSPNSSQTDTPAEENIDSSLDYDSDLTCDSDFDSGYETSCE